MTPRLLRIRDAPTYLGADCNMFNLEFRPWLTEMPIGKQGIAFDRVELTPESSIICATTGVPHAGKELQWAQMNARIPRRGRPWHIDKPTCGREIHTALAHGN